MNLTAHTIRQCVEGIIDLLEEAAIGGHPDARPRHRHRLALHNRIEKR